ncbi:MAG: hypothetical protein ACE5FF_07070, partial [Saprospiraceae bacterium]
YSRIGLGEPVTPALSNMGFGGLSAAYADPLHINFQNPASLGFLAATTFGAGLFTEHSKLDFNDQTTTVWSGNLSHLSLAFPLRNPLNDALAKRKSDFAWGMNISLLPSTAVGYDIQTEEVAPHVDTTLNIFQGTGGTNKLLWGNGFRYKKFAGGINLGYLFGQLESKRSVLFRNLEASYDDRFLDNITIRSFIWSVGAQYRYDFDKDTNDGNVLRKKSLFFGLYGNTSTDFTTHSTIYRIRENFLYSPVQSDTLYQEIDAKESGTLPAEWTFGVIYEDAGRLRLGAEYSTANWSKYRNDAKPEVLFDSRRIAVGAEYTPDIASYNNYLKRIRYRVGFYHRTDPRLTDLTQYAFTLGFGLPVVLPRQKTSFVNFAFELGQYNTSDAIKETFVKMALSFSLNDTSWFFKRKFG